MYARINQRVDIMIQNGLIDEAKKLHEFKNLNALQTVGYRELFDYFEGTISLEVCSFKIPSFIIYKMNYRDLQNNSLLTIALKNNASYFTIKKIIKKVLLITFLTICTV